MKSGIADVTVASAEAMDLVCSKVFITLVGTKEGKRHIHEAHTEEPLVCSTCTVLPRETMHWETFQGFLEGNSSLKLTYNILTTFSMLMGRSTTLVQS